MYNIIHNQIIIVNIRADIETKTQNAQRTAGLYFAIKHDNCLLCGPPMILGLIYKYNVYAQANLA